MACPLVPLPRESASLLLSLSLQQTFIEALSLFGIPQNFVCILHAPYPCPGAVVRMFNIGHPLGCFLEASTVPAGNTFLAGSWGRSGRLGGEPLRERALHSNYFPTCLKYFSVFTSGAAILV